MNVQARSFLQSFAKFRNVYFHPSEDFGRANIFRAVILSYVGIYMGVKWNSRRKAAALVDAKKAQKENILRDALARAAI
uniref:ATP synthase subunit e, mitochondrial n=1 Tax=Strongyloides stercoralis TaxID=6248 RepID=A0A0K0E132_STRER